MNSKFFMNKEKSKGQSMKQHSDNSRNSHTGYMDTGNDTQVQGKARVISNNDNGSHL